MKKLKKFIFNDDVKPKGQQSSIHGNLHNNPSCTENYLGSRFEILFRAIKLLELTSRKLVNNESFITKNL